jgi:hypothetical protein
VLLIILREPSQLRTGFGPTTPLPDVGLLQIPGLTSACLFVTWASRDR